VGRGSQGSPEAGRYVCDLLINRNRYRSLWTRRIVQPTSEEPNQAAVARVIADYLVESGERADSESLHRKMKDRVARLVSHGSVSSETLDWVINAFGMEDHHAHQLRAMFRGDPESDYMAGGWPPKRSSLTEQGLRTVSLHELHTLGPDGCPHSHRTVQVVRATSDDVRSYLYRFDTNALSVEVVRGGRPGPVTDLHNGLHGVEITFDEPLMKDETCSLEYETTFRYREPPPPEFRRGVISCLNNLEIRVQFHAERPPRQVWWGTWEALEGPMADREPVAPGLDLAVHRYLDGVETSIVGFEWEWPDPNVTLS
jgi:hypothetical protein